MAFDARDIAARAGLAHAYAAHHISGNGRSQKLLAQLIAAKARQRRRAHIGLHAYGHGHAAAADMTQGLGHHQAVGIVEARAAKGFGFGQTQQPQIAQTLEYLVRREYFRLLPLIDMRVDLLVDIALQGLAHFQMLMGPLHDLSPLTFCLGKLGWLRRVSLECERATSGPHRTAWDAACGPRPRPACPGRSSAPRACRADRSRRRPAAVRWYRRHRPGLRTWR